MKEYYRTHLILILLSLLLGTSCHNKKSESNFNLEDLALNRGDIVLCGGDDFGEVSFALSCKYDTREIFDLAVSLLHSFEHDEAEKAFVQVLDIDPACAMAYWGLAMCKIGHPKWAPSYSNFEQGRRILELAGALPATTREREYLDAVNAYYRYADEYDKSQHRIRSQKMEYKMGQIYEKYKDDKEAAILYALALFTTADPEDKTYASRRKAGQILESIFPDQPNHPGIAHYIIHNYDNPVLAHKALYSARNYARIAPASAHAQHMPSHIFTRLGLWDESIQSNINSASSAVCYAQEVEMEGHWGDEIHAMDYLVYAYLQKGDNRLAMQQLNYLKNIKAISGATSPYNFTAIPVRIVLENKRWADAAEIEFQESNFQMENYPWSKALVHFARSLGAARSGDLSKAEIEKDILISLYQSLLERNDLYKANQVMIQVKAAGAWIELAKGNNSEALNLMKESVELENNTEKHPITPGEVIPAYELLGDLLMKMNKPDEALIAYEKSIELSPNRFNGIYGAASAAKGAGESDKAIMYFKLLIERTEASNSDRTEILEAKEYIIIP